MLSSPSLNVRDSSFLHFLNALSAIVLTFAGTVRDCSSLHSLKLLSPISVTESGIEIVFSASSLSQSEAGMTVSPLGSVRLSSLDQYLNAAFSSVVTLSGTVTSVRLELLVNAS